MVAVATPADSVHAVAHKVTGESLECTFPADSKISDIKLHIATTWKVPPACQKIILGLRILGDMELLSAYCTNHSPVVHVTMLVSLDGVMYDLEHHFLERRLAGLKVLEDLGVQGGEAAIAAVTLQLSNIHSGIRRAALQTMPKVVTQGDQSVIKALSALLADDVVDVRCTALQALAEVAQPGDDLVLHEVCMCLQDAEFSVRSMALEVLGQVAVKGDTEALEAARACFADKHPTVRRNALKAMAAVAEPGDRRTIDTAIQMLKNQSSSVKCSAMDALVKIAVRGDESAVQAVCSCLNDAHQSVRFMAARVLPKLTDADDPRGRAAATLAMQKKETAEETAARLAELEAKYYKTMTKISERVTNSAVINWMNET
eukprot:TRINITY_DN36537_c0_g1_i1.p1 TRINITY_DN36537_c0_g1~~TRINITY_DN36537_c0_g1_i1.p1  ORF type:complete len:412 (+),score=78.54 TRINITY_DN36537_c0_g1_i1:116-1237(+)